MRIGIDVRYLSHGLIGGIHTYLLHLLPPLFAQANTHQFILYADTKARFELTNLPSNVRVRYLPYRTSLSTFYYDHMFPGIMAPDKLDIAHFPANYGFGPKSSRIVVTLHDHLTLIPISVRETLGPILRGNRSAARTYYLYACTVKALRRTALMLTISDYSRREIIRLSPYDPARILTILHGAPHDITRVADPQVLNQIRAKFELTRPFVLADGLKNPLVILRAWQHLPESLRATHQIVFFARYRIGYPQVNQAITDGTARLLLRPTRAELAALYSMAQVFVFPTWVEGFGLPILEAMACGAPIIASDRGSVPEVAGDATLLINAEDEQMLATYLQQLLSSPAQAEALRAKGYARIREFSWDKTAAQTLAAYERALSLPNPD